MALSHNRSNTAPHSQVQIRSNGEVLSDKSEHG